MWWSPCPFCTMQYAGPLIQQQHNKGTNNWTCVLVGLWSYTETIWRSFAYLDCRILIISTPHYLCIGMLTVSLKSAVLHCMELSINSSAGPQHFHAHFFHLHSIVNINGDWYMFPLSFKQEENKRISVESDVSRFPASHSHYPMSVYFEKIFMKSWLLLLLIVALAVTKRAPICECGQDNQ
jgi:hypothetical protein